MSLIPISEEYDVETPHPLIPKQPRLIAPQAPKTARAALQELDLNAIRPKIASRSSLLRTIQELAPQWSPWRMNVEERKAWYRIGDDFYDATCSNSKDWCLVGRKYENKKQFEEAAQSYCRSIRLNPHCASYYFRLGCVQCELGEWNGAIESFHIAIILAPEIIRATYYFNLGYVHSELRSWPEAIDALKAAIQLKPKKHFFHNLIAVCYRHANEYEMSIYHYRLAIALDRIQPAYRRNLAYVYMQQKLWGKAVKAWTGAIKVSTDKMRAELYRNRAFAQAERGYLAVACEDMQKAYDIYTSSSQRKRCREKLERWTARLQGTEQAYLRAQQQLIMEKGDADEDSEKSMKRRAKIRQLAGLIQGEWEEWNGEDVTDSEASDDENNPDLHPSRRKRLDIVKKSLKAPASTLLVKSSRAARPLDDEARFHASTGSAYVRNLILELGLDKSWQEKQAEEEEEKKQLEREERRLQRAKRNEDRILRREAREDALLSGEHLDEHRPVSSSEEDTVDESGSEDEKGSGPRRRHGRHLSTSSSASSFVAPNELHHDADEEDIYKDDHLDPYSSLSKLFIKLRIDSKYLWRFEQASIHLHNIHMTTEDQMRKILPPLGPRLTLMNFLQDRITRMRLSEGLSIEAGSSPTDLTKTHIEWQNSTRNRKVPEYDAQKATESEAARIQKGFLTNPLSIDYQKRRSPSPQRNLAAAQQLVLTASAQQQPPIPAPVSVPTASPNPHSALIAPSPALTAASATPISNMAVNSSPHVSITPASNFSASPNENNPQYPYFLPAPPPPRSLPLNAINSTPIMPASPHNGVPVVRPLSARDRRTLYDATTNVRSSMSPIRNIGPTSWK